MESLSWKRYDDKYKLSSILTEAARACVDAHTARPEEYLAAYFTKKYTADEIRSVSIRGAYLPSGTQVLRLTLNLLNGMEAESMAFLVPFYKDVDSNANQSVNQITAVEEVLRKSYFPRLLQCGVCKQDDFDKVLYRTRSLADVTDVGLSVLYGLSSVAATAAAQCLSTPLFMYLRQSIGLIDDSEMFVMPQPCIAFFGPDNGFASRLALKDVFLILTMPRGLICRDVVQKIFAAFHHFSQVHNTGRRSDGSLLFDGCDNLTDAVTLAEEAVRAVGLVPVEDVCIGLRLAANTTNGSGNVNSNNTNTVTTVTAASSVGVSAGKDKDQQTDVMYALFPGDVGVTGAQVAEYVREQLQNRTDFVIYVEDTHSDRDAAGLRRLRARLGDSVTVSGRELYSRENYKKVEQGLCELWTSNVVVEPDAVGSLSDVYGIVRRVRGHEGCSVSIATQDLVGNAATMAHLAVGMEARFICMGGLLSVSQCEVLSHLLCIQDELDTARTLRREAPKISSMELPEVPTDTVPEVKRRLDKKKRKK